MFNQESSYEKVIVVDSDSMDEENILLFESFEDQIVEEDNEDLDDNDEDLESEEQSSSRYELENNSSLSSTSKPKKKKKNRNNARDNERKRLRNRLRSIPIRIFRTDIRRKIPLILANIFNSYDVNLLQSFMSKFCRPDATMKQLMYFDSVPNVITLNDPLRMIQYFTSLIQLCPDQILRLTSPDILIRTSFTGNSEIKFPFITYGTKLYPYTPKDIIEIFLMLDSLDIQHMNLMDLPVFNNTNTKKDNCSEGLRSSMDLQLSVDNLSQENLLTRPRQIENNQVPPNIPALSQSNKPPKLSKSTKSSPQDLFNGFDPFLLLKQLSSMHLSNAPPTILQISGYVSVYVDKDMNIYNVFFQENTPKEL